MDDQRRGEHEDEWLGLVKIALDNRLFAVVVFSLAAVVIIGLEQPVLCVGALLAGYVLIDRFHLARGATIVGSAVWLTVVLAGRLVMRSIPVPIFFGFDYLMTMCGFLLAVGACSAYLVGARAYGRGRECGRNEADAEISAHLVGRLIDGPDARTDLDEAYPAVDAAITRVRERQRIQEQALRDEADRKDDLVTYLAHDLKTPLASVVGYLSLLEEAPELPVELRTRFTGIALEKAHRLDSLTEEFFDITRFDFHDIVLTRGYVDLNLMLGQVADEFYPALVEAGKTAAVEVPAGLTALVDGDKMARVFNNVMKNALAYSYEGSQIRIGAERSGEVVRITFENEGDPIPEAKLKVIFEKFYRLDAARSTDRGGAGLGLAIAREIVAAHGGTISCTSTPEHTVFTIELPA